MTTDTSNLSFTVKRLKSFLSVFKHNTRGLIGIGTLVLFISLAIAAPLLTPYDPVNQQYIAGDYAVPIWMKYFPNSQGINENFKLVNDPGFSTLTSLQEWRFQTEPPSAPSIGLTYEGTTGSGTPRGCAAITFKRTNAREYAGDVEATITKEFVYSYTTTPRRLIALIEIMTQGAGNLDSIEMKVYIDQQGGNKTYLWLTRISTDVGWTTPSPAMDTYDINFKKKFGNTTVDPAKIIFTGPATYTYGVDITFKDKKPGTLGQDFESIVYIDNIDLDLWGNAFGLLGTDQWGRDIFSQLVYGARISLFVGLLATGLSVGIGLLVGLISGYIGKIGDELIMRFTDALLVLPTLPLLLVLVAVLGSSIWNLIMVIGLLGWMGFARTIRSQVLSLRERPFVESAKAIGSGKFHIITKHIMPNVMNLVYVTLALSVPGAILSEAALSWLGLFDPSVMSWGRMLHDAQFYQGYDKWWWVIPPGVCIALVSLSFILVGYALDEILNPRLRMRR